MAKRHSIAGAIKAAAQGMATEPPSEQTTSDAPSTQKPFTARTREGKKMIAAPVDPAARQQLKVLAAERGGAL